MANVTDAQRKAFFLYCGKYGASRMRELLKEITGVSSLRAPGMTIGKMGVFIEYVKEHPPAPSPTRPVIIKHGSYEIHLITQEQKRTINQLKAALGYDRSKYNLLSKLIVGRTEPLTRNEAGAIIREMQKIHGVQQRHRSRSTKLKRMRYGI
jgi:hypothetical protein